MKKARVAIPLMVLGFLLGMIVITLSTPDYRDIQAELDTTENILFHSNRVLREEIKAGNCASPRLEKLAQLNFEVVLVPK